MYNPSPLSGESASERAMGDAGADDWAHAAHFLPRRRSQSHAPLKLCATCRGAVPASVAGDLCARCAADAKHDRRLKIVGVVIAAALLVLLAFLVANRPRSKGEGERAPRRTTAAASAGTSTSASSAGRRAG